MKQGFNEEQKKILSYLRTSVRSGHAFFKSKHIGKEIGLSSKEVGTNMGILAEECKDLKITRWSYSISTTWMVEMV